MNGWTWTEKGFDFTLVTQVPRRKAVIIKPGLL